MMHNERKLLVLFSSAAAVNNVMLWVNFKVCKKGALHLEVETGCVCELYIIYRSVNIKA